MRADINQDSFIDIETLIQSNLLVLGVSDYGEHLELLRKLV